MKEQSRSLGAELEGWQSFWCPCTLTDRNSSMNGVAIYARQGLTMRADCEPMKDPVSETRALLYQSDCHFHEAGANNGGRLHKCSHSMFYNRCVSFVRAHFVDSARRRHSSSVLLHYVTAALSSSYVLCTRPQNVAYPIFLTNTLLQCHPLDRHFVFSARNSACQLVLFATSPPLDFIHDICISA